MEGFLASGYHNKEQIVSDYSTYGGCDFIVSLLLTIPNYTVSPKTVVCSFNLVQTYFFFLTLGFVHGLAFQVPGIVHVTVRTY